jgi:hypothetical protein
LSELTGQAGWRAGGKMGMSVVTDLLFEEIIRTVADAIATEGVVWASTAARQLKEAYAGCAFTEREIESLVIGFASKAGVPVEFGHPVRLSPPLNGPFGETHEHE